MRKRTTSYNERAWAIDVINEINRWAEMRSRAVRSAGGEWGLASSEKGNTLFPDVLLFGDAAKNAVLQGWELKMPDTPVTDRTLIDNARQKATRLGLSSFLVWNAVDAALHRIEGEDSVVMRTWRCDKIRRRDDVQHNCDEWRKTLLQILDDVCDFVERDDISRCKPLPEKLNDVVAAILSDTVGVVLDRLNAEYRCSKRWRTHVDSWWADVKAAHDEKHLAVNDATCFSFLASEILLHWIHRFLFAHYLKRFSKEAVSVENLIGTATIQDAEHFFLELSMRRDYAQVFGTRQGAALLPDAAWRSLLAFNSFLNAVRLSDISQDLYHESLQSVVRASQRKLSGQFCTPIKLARLLVALTVDNLEKPVLDPCCGTGTIARAVLDLKTSVGIPTVEATKTTFASDLHPMPLQFATLALASGDSPFETIRVFQRDVFEIRTGEDICFVDARTGQKCKEKLPEFTCIVMNPPFIRFENWMKSPIVRQLNEKILVDTGVPIDAKADYFVPVTLAASRLLPPDGRLGVIFPNTWLGAGWAKTFRAQILSLFAVETIVTSGNGRWFADAKIVTQLVVMRKRRQGECAQDSDETVFAVTQNPVAHWTADLAVSLNSNSSTDQSGVVSRFKLTHSRIRKLESSGLSWAAFFVDLAWFDQVEPSLVRICKHFTVARGERRGWDPLFYPPADCGVEKDYLRPVLKTSASVRRLQAAPDAFAFCCSKTLDELSALGHRGALSWIRKFERAVNKKGKPLAEVLKRSGQHWYEMRPDTVADLAVSINPGSRLFFIRLTERAFTNQRLTRLAARKTTDLDLCHALLCSFMGCFYLEAIGFGRGLGALDLSATRVRDQFWMLDPDRVTPVHRKRILAAFDKLKRRDVFDLEKEAAQTDRRQFEESVLAAFGLKEILPDLEKALLTLYRIRNCVKKD